MSSPVCAERVITKNSGSSNFAMTLLSTASSMRGVASLVVAASAFETPISAATAVATEVKNDLDLDIRVSPQLSL